MGSILAAPKGTTNHRPNADHQFPAVLRTKTFFHFLFAIAPPVKSKRNWLCSLLPETGFARHRAIGSHASCPCVAPGQRQFLGHFGTGPKEHLIGRLPVER